MKQSKTILKACLLVCFLIFLTQSINIFQKQKNNLQINQPITEGDYIENGSAITPEFKANFKGIVEEAYVFNGASYFKNVAYIKDKLTSKYPGNWFIGIFGSFGNTSTPAKPGQNIGISTYSTDGQYWLYWQGLNHYQPLVAYYVSKQDVKNTTNTTSYVCFYESNYTSTTDVFKNVVNAAEIDYHDIQNLTAQVQGYLASYSPASDPTVIAIKPNVTMFACQWGQNYGNYWQRTDRQGLNVMSIPKI